jgi:geranylgeranyl diphosphate synthase, type II
MVDAAAQLEAAMEGALARAEAGACPPRLAAAVRHAVFPGGARVRPRLCLAVAAACGDDDPLLSLAAATALELLHCASLVHDDLPCFDDAPLRRGRASVHRAFGEALALLAGDALIVLAFETLAHGAAKSPHRLRVLLAEIARAAGMPAGIAAGQAWECEPRIDLAQYQQSKTGSLFAAASVAGAASAGADGEAWRELGARLGEAYQVADDIGDAVSTQEQLGKPVGRDALLARPNAALRFGIPGAMRRLDALLAAAIGAVPSCRGADELKSLILFEGDRFLPKDLARRAA